MIRVVDVVILPDGRMDRKNAALYLGLSVKTLATHGAKELARVLSSAAEFFTFRAISTNGCRKARLGNPTYLAATTPLRKNDSAAGPAGKYARCRLRFTHLLRPGGLPASPPSLRSVASRRQRGSAKH